MSKVMGFEELMKHIENLPPPTEDQIKELRRNLHISDYEDFIGKPYDTFVKFMFQERLEYNLVSVDGRAIKEHTPRGLQVHVVFDKIESFDYNLDWYEEYNEVFYGKDQE
jgi:hypothetical protein